MDNSAEEQGDLSEITRAMFHRPAKADEACDAGARRKNTPKAKQAALVGRGTAGNVTIAGLRI